VAVPSSTVTQFVDRSAEPAVLGFIHQPVQSDGRALILTHGAGADCRTKLLVSVAEAFAEGGFLVLRCNLPFRQERPYGPPRPGSAELDREGLRRAVEIIKLKTPGPVFLGGHSYGGRQASMLAAEQPDLVAGLLLLSYPLHPPRRPEQLRTAHFPSLTTPAFFVYGVRDSFGSFEELSSAVTLIPARTNIFEVEGAGHELLGRKNQDSLGGEILNRFQAFVDT
jgi:uncharacterized protein